MPTILRAPLFLLLTVFGLMLGGCSEKAGQPVPRPVVTAGAGTGDLFLHGVVERDGSPVKGAQVAVVLTPVAAARNAEVGDVIPQFTAATADTGADGAFALRLKADDLPSKYFESGRDFVNFDLNVSLRQEFAVWGSTLWPVGKPTVWRTAEEAVSADSAMGLVLDLGRKRITVTDSFDERKSTPLTVMRPPAPSK